jgi:hypothetical protein
MRLTTATWDPQQPGQAVDGIPQLPCTDAGCRIGFIGDYFGVAISGTKSDALFVSTRYLSNVTADGGGPVDYQQQVLGTVSRAALGI